MTQASETRSNDVICYRRSPRKGGMMSGTLAQCVLQQHMLNKRTTVFLLIFLCAVIQLHNTCIGFYFSSFFLSFIKTSTIWCLELMDQWGRKWANNQSSRSSTQLERLHTIMPQISKGRHQVHQLQSQTADLYMWESSLVQKTHAAGLNSLKIYFPTTLLHTNNIKGMLFKVTEFSQSALKP